MLFIFYFNQQSGVHVSDEVVNYRRVPREVQKFSHHETRRVEVMVCRDHDCNRWDSVGCHHDGGYEWVEERHPVYVIKEKHDHQYEATRTFSVGQRSVPLNTAAVQQALQRCRNQLAAHLAKASAGADARLVASTLTQLDTLLQQYRRASPLDAKVTVLSAEPVNQSELMAYHRLVSQGQQIVNQALQVSHTRGHSAHLRAVLSTAASDMQTLPLYSVKGFDVATIRSIADGVLAGLDASLPLKALLEGELQPLRGDAVTQRQLMDCAQQVITHVQAYCASRQRSGAFGLLQQLTRSHRDVTRQLQPLVNALWLPAVQAMAASLQTTLSQQTFTEVLTYSNRIQARGAALGGVLGHFHDLSRATATVQLDTSALPTVLQQRLAGGEHLLTTTLLSVALGKIGAQAVVVRPVPAPPPPAAANAAVGGAAGAESAAVDTGADDDTPHPPTTAVVANHARLYPALPVASAAVTASAPPPSPPATPR